MLTAPFHSGGLVGWHTHGARPGLTPDEKVMHLNMDLFSALLPVNHTHATLVL